jgi:polyhydroxyalkanoate synthase subunit PhaC
VDDDLASRDSAPQQRRAPRPLPLFLELVRQVSRVDPDRAQRALEGLRAYEAAPRPPERPQRRRAASIGGAALRDHGGAGAPLVLVPSLINPPDILDLDPHTSLAGSLAAGGRHVLLLDWGPAGERAGLDVAGHVESLLLPLLRQLGEPAALVGYCLGGTMAIAAAGLVPVERLATLAAPWHFARYPGAPRAALGELWDKSKDAAEALGALPMEVLQAGFWALDPERTVAKFDEFAGLDPASDQARRFVTLEDWANEGEPLPLPAARELFEDLFHDDLSGEGRWMVGGKLAAEQPPVPALHFLAGEDRIVPAATAPAGARKIIASGHVGMVIGRARTELHAELRRFLAS